MDLHASQLTEVAVIEKSIEFAALEEEWDELYEACPTATPFQSWAWLYSWWEHYGKDYQLRLVIVRDIEGRLVGLVPLMLERRLGFGRLLFVGDGLTDYLDMLAKQGCEEQVALAAAEALEELGDWQVADLQELHPQAAAWSILRAWGGPRASLRQSSCPVVDVGSWDKVLASLSKNHRSTVRRAIRKAEKDGVRCKLVGLADVEEAATRWMMLHQEAWRERSIAPEHLDEGFKEYLVAAAYRMTERGIGGVSEYRRDGEVVAAQFLIFGHDFVGQHLFGATQEFLRRYQVSSLYIRDALNVACARRSTCLNMLRGEEPYKLRWASRIITNHRLVLGRDRLSCNLYGGYQALRSRVERYAYSQEAPGWIKKALTVRLTLRRRVRTKRSRRV